MRRAKSAANREPEPNETCKKNEVLAAPRLDAWSNECPVNYESLAASPARYDRHQDYFIKVWIECEDQLLLTQYLADSKPSLTYIFFKGFFCERHLLCVILPPGQLQIPLNARARIVSGQLV